MKPLHLLSLSLVLACTDVPTAAPVALPTGPARLQRTVTIGGQEYLLFRTFEEARSQVAYAKIYDYIPAVYWSGNTAIAHSTMYYFGTEGEQILTLTAKNATEVAQGGGTSVDIHMLPWNYSFRTTDVRVEVPPES